MTSTRVLTMTECANGPILVVMTKEILCCIDFMGMSTLS